MQKFSIKREYELYDQFRLWASLESHPEQLELERRNFSEHTVFDPKKMIGWYKVTKEEMEKFENTVNEILSRQNSQYWSDLETKMKEVKEWSEEKCKKLEEGNK